MHSVEVDRDERIASDRLNLKDHALSESRMDDLHSLDDLVRLQLAFACSCRLSLVTGKLGLKC